MEDEGKSLAVGLRNVYLPACIHQLTAHRTKSEEHANKHRMNTSIHGLRGEAEARKGSWKESHRLQSGCTTGNLRKECPLKDYCKD